MPRRILHDKYFLLAKEHGYLARSAYKLKQINHAKSIISPGDTVLDLGCAPGAWIQVALELVAPEGGAGGGNGGGDGGRVVGVDLQEVRRSFGPNATTIVGDIYDLDPAVILEPVGHPFDVVLSDMAPSTSGHGDAERSAHLCHRVLQLLPHLARPGANLAMKVLEGSEYKQLLDHTKTLFANCRAYKPKASRDSSSEMYIVAHRYRPPKS